VKLEGMLQGRRTQAQGLARMSDTDDHHFEGRHARYANQRFHGLNRRISNASSGCLARATETSVRHAPGFVSASLHRSLDGTKVTMYAQWRTIEDYEANAQNPAPAPFLQEALAFARFEPGMYEVVESYSPAGESA